MNLNGRRSSLAASLVSGFAFGLCGCSMGGTNLSGPSAGTPTAGIAVGGVVHGGQNPVSGATLQLYAAGQPAMPTSGLATGGYGLGGTALLTPGSMTVGSTNNYWPNGSSTLGPTCTYIGSNTNKCTALPQSDASGNFTITSDYTCPSGASQVYLVATGGNPGLGGTVNNPYLALMAGLGSCSTLKPTTVIFIDEVTTVAAVWSLQQFLAAPDGTHAASAYSSQGGPYTGVGVNIGASSGPVGGYGPDLVQSQEVGLQNAFRMIANLVNNTTGSAVPPANSWATPYTSKINAIANTLAYCVNSDGLTANNCITLMGDATATSLAPHDTIQAAWMMAQNPLNNASTLLALGAATAPFQPSLASTAPNLDLTIEVGLAPVFGASSGVAGSSAIYDADQVAIDENGRIWVYSISGSSNTGLTAPYLAEIDANGNALGSPFQSYTVPAGNGLPACTTTATHTLAGANDPMAIDQNSNLWGGNLFEPPSTCGSYTTVRTLFKLDTDTATMQNGYWESGGPGAVVVDAANDIWWITNNSFFQSISSNGSYAISEYGPGNDPYAATADLLGNVWLESADGCTLGSSTEGLLYQMPISSLGAASSAAVDEPSAGFFTSGGTACKITSPTPTASETITATQGTIQNLATDANNGIWGVNETANSIIYFAPQSNAWTTAVAGSSTIPVTGALNASTGTLNTPYAVAVDGANHAWVVGNSVTTGYGDALEEFGVAMQSGTNNIASISTLNGANGFIFPGTATPFPHYEHSVSVDPSGNIWISSGTTVNYLTVVVGAASPVVTPIALQTEYGLVGAASPSTLMLSASSLSYANTGVGNTSAAQTVMLTNAGISTISLESFTFTGTNTADFTIASNGCSTILLSGATCSLTVSFAPTNSGARLASLLIGNNSATANAMVSLSGTGIVANTAATPFISPVGGTYTVVQNVVITDTTPGSTIYYTLNGNTPTASSTQYTQPFLVNSTETVTAIAIAPGYSNSALATAAYTINLGLGVTLGTATVNTTGTQTSVGKSFLGFSSDFAQTSNIVGTSSGTTASATLNTSYVNLIANLARYTNGPIVFRELNDNPLSAITTGNAADVLATNAAFYNTMKSSTTYGVQFWFGVTFQNDFSTANQGCGSASNSTVTIYADCTSANDAYTIATSMPSSSVLGIELGNEPDLYSSSTGPASSGSLNGVTWNYANLLTAYQAIVPGIQASLATIPQPSSALPSGNDGAIMFAPVFADTSTPWSTDVAGFISAESSNMSYLNLHFYAGYYNTSTNNIEPADFLMSTAALNPTNLPTSPTNLANTSGTNLIQLAHTTKNAAGNDLSFRIGEMNSIAGGGQPGVSNTFQSALWLMDQGVQFATYGVDGINIFDGGTYYDPFVFKNVGSYPNYTYTLSQIDPIYYGMLMTDMFLQNNAALLPVALSTSHNFKAYATVDKSNAVRVLLINKEENTGGTVTLTVPGHGAATLDYLLATNNSYLVSDYTTYTANDQVTIGGQTFKGSTNGLIQGTQSLLTINPSGSTYTVSMPQASAVLVTIP